MKVANKTDIGRIRLVNEDRSVVQMELNGFVLAIVADGMGGHQAGDIASQMAIEVIQNQLQTLEKDMSIDMCKAALQSAIVLANRTIYEFAQSREQYHGMGTTVVAILANEQFLAIGHIGDSRAYLITTDNMTQLTEDHSLVTELLKSGQITAEEADHHPRRNVLTRALGTDAFVEAEVGHYEWQQNDIVLMCSDGLSGQLDSHEIFTILHKEEDLNWKADQLVKEALGAGGDDNISVILLGNEPILRGDHS
ncbi:Stp1/IreP family PP2C-type Ser/Thr phosphatase [Paenibacillus psychroresistens]|uniref:Stp1/IreP family PP2C-type Ser/Thr phosphatase n=1 Tax=Paenibacillus psychroresistens TaxID=1778678 RepID=A0A6B8RLN8_9BACL|nr:Stp1/IreP family PP2C-type Ser/Thr phosphatase [Paenibacillus psychroresistens]QGQ96939.1 Stp1/IreP family PP2C-type Ser/Thr phosphatase [Paenibacillus psychroresistens]